MSRTTDTFAFTSEKAAHLFAEWLRQNAEEWEHGFPKLIAEGPVSPEVAASSSAITSPWSMPIEYEVERGAHFTFVKGIATGLELACKS